MAARRLVLGPEHPETLAAMANLAVILWVTGEPARGLDLQEEVVATEVRLWGPAHVDTQASMEELALMRARAETM